jgi:hypothetical protein
MRTGSNKRAHKVKIGVFDMAKPPVGIYFTTRKMRHGAKTIAA